MTAEHSRLPGAETSETLGTSFRETAWRVLKATRIFDPTTWQLKRLIRWILVMTLAVVAFGVGRHGVVRIHEHQVGVLVNNVTGKLTLKPHVGYLVFLPYLARVYVLDKTIQRLELTWAQPGAAPRDVKLKVADGAQVSLDLTLNFKLRPDLAVRVLRRSGLNTRFAEIWVESMVRHHALTTFGDLTMEQFYDATRRAEKAAAIQTQVNEKLRDEGIEIVAVIPGEYRFYREYEQIIEEKKLADQQVEEQQAQARAAKEDQERRIVEKRSEIEVRQTTFNGEMAARLAQAEADAEKKRREADGQYRFTLLQADSKLYTMKKQAEASLEQGKAEAEGLAKNRAAMQGEGGLNMVAMEYARQLQKMRITGTPITKDSAIRQFSVQAADAAVTKGGRP
jgi:hypothetical protein